MDPQPVKVPPTFKTLLPFIRRAEELDRDTSRPESKLIAYFCRQYAMELGIKLRENDSSNEATDYLLSLMDRLEEEKNKLPDFTQEEGKEICEDFAMEIFSKADDEDRAGMATKSTARTFYAAGTFFDILSQFGDLSEDVVEKRRYCKFKAATILKAIKEGKTPTPGPPEGLDMKIVTVVTPPLQPSEPAYNPTSFPSLTESVRSAGAMSASELDNTWAGPSATHSPPAPSAPSHSAPAAPPSPAYSVPLAPPPPAASEAAYQQPPAPTPAYQPPPAPTPAYQPPSAPTPPYQPPPSYTPQSTPACTRNTPVSQNEINDAIEYAKFAVAALKVKDMKLAEERLEMALRNIRGA
ncbi:vacuolar protein sorting-associated protein VTA1 [Phytophthora infestans T30-4]|uniref:Vacuolar protein sorting-associated protein VTA1 n=1 Tax=Phytophthora infestans (strain T30-4) TaxID=403677 RepID=D0MXZ0_PHYIT|nr:vacuolar protein sorting-associated protein VTA1 [Phytophthora infestans T30-4]EEY66038.1 vacuolar protein sorting-associated protein VTA1 [Phytophthora infestans T30-4]|eukprot:XP_002906637.1 vacuolar protein sorting-associated protein VTA1 [Phytophthora infestans T30-4]